MKAQVTGSLRRGVAALVRGFEGRSCYLSSTATTRHGGAWNVWAGNPDQGRLLRALRRGTRPVAQRAMTCPPLQCIDATRKPSPSRATGNATPSVSSALTRAHHMTPATATTATMAATKPCSQPATCRPTAAPSPVSAWMRPPSATAPRSSSSSPGQAGPAPSQTSNGSRWHAVTAPLSSRTSSGVCVDDLIDEGQTGVPHAYGTDKRGTAGRSEGPPRPRQRLRPQSQHPPPPARSTAKPVRPAPPEPCLASYLPKSV